MTSGPRLLRLGTLLAIAVGMGAGCAGATSEQSTVEVVARTLEGASSLRAGPNGELLWTTRRLNGALGGALWRLRGDDREPEEVAAYAAFDLAVAGDHVFFASGTDSATERLGVARVALSGGDADWYFRNGTDGVASGLALDDEHVYWTVRGAEEGAYRAPHAGFGTISSGDALVGADVMRIVAIDELWGRLVLASGYLYWLAHDGIERVSTDGGAIETVLSREQWSCCFSDKPLELLVRGDYVYWVSGEDKTGGLGRVRTDGSDPQPLFTDMTEGLQSELVMSAVLAADDEHVYWSRGLANRVVPEHGEQEILRMPLEGGDVQLVASQQNGVSAIVPTESHVYWSNAVSAVIARIAKDEIR